MLHDAPGVTQYHVVHVLTPGAISISFSAPLPACHTGDWISDTPMFPSTIGDSQHGVTVDYGTCLYSPIHVLTINLQTYGTTPECCCYPPAPHPETPSGEIEMVDCGYETNFVPHDHGSFINNSPYVVCVGADGVCECERTVPVDASTWGGIKALYKR